MSSPSSALAADAAAGIPGADAFRLDGAAHVAPQPAARADRPIYAAADAAPVEEAPNIHGFAAVKFLNSYITPRGLVVQNDDLTIQPIVGLVMPLSDQWTFVGGVWNNITTAQSDDEVGSWNEMDPFFTLAYALNSKTELSATYVPFLSPPNAFETEHNIEFALKYTGVELAEGVTLNPYAKLFWAVAGDSTVVTGKAGDTFYVELGVVPTFKYGGVKDYPMTVTLPTYFHVGPSEYWGGENNFGVVSTGINVNVPLTHVIPARYGLWSVDLGANYYYLANGSLVDAATILGNSDGRHWGVGYLNIGFRF